MSHTNIKSYWLDGNLIFGRASGSATPVLQFGRTSEPLQVKIHNRASSSPTSDAFALEVKTEFGDTDAEHHAVIVTADWRASGVAGGGNRAGHFMCRVRSGQTASSTANIIGVQGIIQNNGTINGSGLHAGVYGLIESGGTWTSVGRVASAWFDSHLAATPGSGSVSLVYLSNNGAATVSEAFYIYAGDAITNLFTISTANGMVSDGAATPSSTMKKIKVDIDGDTLYLLAAATWS